MGHCGPAGMVTVDHTDRGVFCICVRQWENVCSGVRQHMSEYICLLGERASWHEASTTDFFGISSFLAFTMEKHKHSQESLWCHTMRHWRIHFLNKTLVFIQDPLNVHCLIREKYPLAGCSSSHCDWSLVLKTLAVLLYCDHNTLPVCRRTQTKVIGVHNCILCRHQYVCHSICITCVVTSFETTSTFTRDNGTCLNGPVLMEGKPVSVNDISKLFLPSIKGNGVSGAATASTLFGAVTI